MILLNAFQCIQAFSLLAIAYFMYLLVRSFEKVRVVEFPKPYKAKEKEKEPGVAWKKPTSEKKYRAQVYEE